MVQPPRTPAQPSEPAAPEDPAPADPDVGAGQAPDEQLQLPDDPPLAFPTSDAPGG